MSIIEDIIENICNYYRGLVKGGSKEELRNFYVTARSALDKGFKNAEKSYSGDRRILDSAYQQAVKSLRTGTLMGASPGKE